MVVQPERSVHYITARQILDNLESSTHTDMIRVMVADVHAKLEIAAALRSLKE